MLGKGTSASSRLVTRVMLVERTRSQSLSHQEFCVFFEALDEGEADASPRCAVLLPSIHPGILQMGRDNVVPVPQHPFGQCHWHGERPATTPATKIKDCRSKTFNG